MPSSSEIKCCCGRDDCAFLQHNTAALEELEKDVETAARLGQELLDRYESYMSEAEDDRTRMLRDLEKLEKEKQEMRAENARIIEENRTLVDQLEDMNQQSTELDAYIKSLTTALESSQLEVRRLAVAASRAAQLESQLSDLEGEQTRLQDKLTNSHESEKSAVQRWRSAESTVRDLQDQLDKIEKESQEEREKHLELLDRMEQKRVDKDAESVTNNSNRAGSASSSRRSKGGTTVVSHFVRDILQDNTSLQRGIVELREMLQNSDDEIRNLREQILMHQPLEQGPADSPRRHNMRPLSEELRAESPLPISPQLHVHHHYHGLGPSPPSKKDKLQPVFHRRQKKRRPVFPPTLPESPIREAALSRVNMVSHTPRASTSSASTAFSSLPSPSGYDHRWSTSTTSQVMSSSPSSPQSVYRAGSIFDRVDRGFESSRPTSPESTGFSSPGFGRYHRRKQSDVSLSPKYETDDIGDSPGVPTSHDSGPLGSTKPSIEIHTPDAAPGQAANGFPSPRRDAASKSSEPNEQSYLSIAVGGRGAAGLSSSVPAAGNSIISSLSYFRQVKRSSSHESLASVSGMDIHSSVPTSNLQRTYFGLSAKPPSRMSSAGTIFSSVDPVISRTNITIPKLSVSTGGSDDRTSVALLSSVASAANRDRSSVRASTRPPSIDDAITTSPSKPLRIGQRVGGWVLDRLGTSAREPDALHSQTTGTPSAEGSDTFSVRTLGTSVPVLPRLPGVNQKGPILWLRPPPPAPSILQPRQLDEELLQQSLQE